MELYRPLIDRLILKLINLKIITAEDYTKNESYKFLKMNGKRKVSLAYQDLFEGRNYRKVLIKQVNILKKWIKNKEDLTFYEIN